MRLLSIPAAFALGLGIAIPAPVHAAAEPSFSTVVHPATPPCGEATFTGTISAAFPSTWPRTDAVSVNYRFFYSSSEGSPHTVLLSPGSNSATVSLTTNLSSPFSHTGAATLNVTGATLVRNGRPIGPIPVNASASVAHYDFTCKSTQSAGGGNSGGNAAGNGGNTGPTGSVGNTGHTGNTGGINNGGGSNNNAGSGGSANNGGASNAGPIGVTASLSLRECGNIDRKNLRDAVFLTGFKASFPAGFSGRLLLQARLRSTKPLGPVNYPINVVLSPSAPSQTMPELLPLSGDFRKGVAFLTVDKAYVIPATGPVPQIPPSTSVAIPQIENAQMPYDCSR